MPLTRMAWAWIKHKWFVMRAGAWLEVPWWQLVLHDLSKLSPQEFPHYARRFYGDGDNDDAFERCWLHHQNHNPHHWQWWIDRSTGLAVPMPMHYVREMVADWLAASRSYQGHWPNPWAWAWLEAHRDKMILHPITQARLEKVLSKLKQEYRA